MSETWTVSGISVTSINQACALETATPAQVAQIVELYNSSEEVTIADAVEQVLEVPAEVQ